jgi:hypothetical protein
VLWRRAVDAVVLLPVGADDPVLLPGTGAPVWELLEQPATLDELLAALREVYGTDAADGASVAADVAALLDRLVDLGAVELDPRV